MVILLLGIIALLFIYVILMKREINKISNELRKRRTFKKDEKITINLLDRSLEALAEEINKEIDRAREEKVKQIKEQNKLRELIANISHDLRTPLTSILGYLQIIKKKEYEKHKEKYLDIINKRAEDLEILLNSFFMLSVAESNEYMVDVESINIKEVLYNALGDFYDEFEEKNIEPEIIVEEVESLVFGGREEIKRIIDNLLSNLLKYGEDDIKIILKQGENNVSLEVVNKAKNIEYLDTNKIFDKFYKLDEARSTYKKIQA